MNPTHIGSLPNGKRVHLTDAKGWSACSRWTHDVSPIEKARVRFDDAWYGTCLARLADHAATLLTVATARRETPDVAWGYVLDGFRRGLTVANLPPTTARDRGTPTGFRHRPTS